MWKLTLESAIVGTLDKASLSALATMERKALRQVAVEIGWTRLPVETAKLRRELISHFLSLDGNAKRLKVDYRKADN